MSQQNKIESVKAIYNTIGKEFSASRSYIWPDLKPFLDKINSQTSRTVLEVLDVGCGNGRLLLGLPKNVKYTGIDISKTLLKEAKTIHPNHKFSEADITKKQNWQSLPRYDYILCVAVLHHLPTKKDQLFVLDQIKKHLKPKGKCLITVWNLWQPKYLKYHLDLKTKLQNPHFVYIPFQGQSRFCFAFTLPYLRKLLKQSRLKLKIKKSPHNYLIY